MASRSSSSAIKRNVRPGFIVVCAVILFAFVATLYPSWSASRILPAEALRYE